MSYTNAIGPVNKGLYNDMFYCVEMAALQHKKWNLAKKI